MLLKISPFTFKLRLGPMLGFKRLRRAATTIAGKNI
jgi:hypothetical protein